MQISPLSLCHPQALLPFTWMKEIHHHILVPEMKKQEVKGTHLLFRATNWKVHTSLTFTCYWSKISHMLHITVREDGKSNLYFGGRVPRQHLRILLLKGKGDNENISCYTQEVASHCAKEGLISI